MKFCTLFRQRSSHFCVIEAGILNQFQLCVSSTSQNTPEGIFWIVGYETINKSDAAYSPFFVSTHVAWDVTNCKKVEFSMILQLEMSKRHSNTEMYTFDRTTKHRVNYKMNNLFLARMILV